MGRAADSVVFDFCPGLLGAFLSALPGQVGQGIARIPRAMWEFRRMQFGGLVAIEHEMEGPVEDDRRCAVACPRSLS